MNFNINDTLLGKTAATAEKYDPTLLFRIPRSENRVHYDLDDDNLPFVGFDVWNCYEVSFLTDNGLPVSRVMKMVYAADSQYLVESKSLKLYLNSFNMDCWGNSVAEAEKRVEATVSKDLISLLETQVSVSLFDSQAQVSKPFPGFEKVDLALQVPLKLQESIQFTRFNESPDLIRSEKTNEKHVYLFKTDMLRSNCRVTNQPDWGDLFVQLTSYHVIDLSSILEYLVSFRKENHFHEEVVEMIYKRFWDIFEPETLMVAAMYTRRGGIDINPIRASYPELIDEILVSTKLMVEKTQRQ
jgi:7-cyano-7-deazaguanine reductase